MEFSNTSIGYSSLSQAVEAAGTDYGSRGKVQAAEFANTPPEMICLKHSLEHGSSKQMEFANTSVGQVDGVC